MSVEMNKTLVRQAAELFRAETMDEYLQYYHPDAALHFLPPGLPPGREGARLFYQVFMTAFPDARVRIDDLLGEGDKMACRFTLTGTHLGEFRGLPPTGNAVTVTGITIFRIENGQYVERWSEVDFLGLLQQLGAVAV